MGINIKWDITYKCNLNCAHCVNGDLLGKLEDELTTQEAKKVIAKLKLAGAEYVHLLGGEPTARTDILEIFEEFERQDLNFGFNTNGLKLINEEFRMQIVKNKNLRNIVFSLEGPNAEVNDKIRGKKVFDITTKNVKEIVELKKRLNRKQLRLTINIVVNKINLEYITEMVHFCEALGVNEIVCLQFIPEGNGKTLDVELTTDDSLELIKRLAECYKNVKGRIEIVPRFVFPLAEKYAREVLKAEFPEGSSMCGAGENFFYLNNKGELYPCDRYKKRILELNESADLRLEKSEMWEIASRKGFEELFQRAENEITYQDYIPCNRCEFLGKSCYPCPAQENVKQIDVCKKMMEEIENVQNE